LQKTLSKKFGNALFTALRIGHHDIVAMGIIDPAHQG
jgi:hypothetical protein